MKIDDIVEKIIRECDENYSLNEKIRYVYISLGQYLSKNTDFFLSMYGKLKELNLSSDEIQKVYEDNGNDTKVICRSSAYILKRIFDYMGIESKLMETENAEEVDLNDSDIEENDSEKKQSFEVNHWFLAVKGEENKTYFLTLTADLPQIQMNLSTKHFATNIPYLREGIDGTIKQSYKGDEIHHSIMSDDELKRIDTKIGYCHTKYYDGDKLHLNYENESLNMLREASSNNKEYLIYLEENTPFYNKLINFYDASGNKINLREEKVSGITPDDWTVWLKIACEDIQKKLVQELNLKNDFEKSKFTDTNHKEWNFNEWYNLLKGKLNDANIDNSKYNVLTNPNKVLGSIKGLKSFIDDGLKRKDKFQDLLHFLSYSFIDSELLPGDDYISTNYLANKFEYIFSKIFTKYSSIPLSKMEYGESSVAISQVMEIIFPEVNYKNSCKSLNYDETISPIKNRIKSSGIKNKNTGEYEFVFGIVGDIDDYQYYYKFNPKTCKLKSVNFFDVAADYIVISNKFNGNIVNIENIEEENNKKSNSRMI